jgi:2-(1,2-epoxy-1,2-dihydrophenyl)acetyl-CoA isomerase
MPGIKRERDGSIAILTLDEPQTLNALTPELLLELAAAIDTQTADDTVRALVLTGAGRGFCSGQNLKAARVASADLVDWVMKTYWPAFKALRECRVPVVVGVNGVAAGGGCSLAMAGDLIVAARSAKFVQVFSRIGLVPDLGSTWLLPRLVGRQRALEMMMLNEPLGAEQARQWGMVHEVVDDEALLEGAIRVARKLADGPTRALVATRQLLDASEQASFVEQFTAEIRVQAVMRDSADALEGRQAFAERRPARFRGV